MNFQEMQSVKILNNHTRGGIDIFCTSLFSLLYSLEKREREREREREGERRERLYHWHVHIDMYTWYKFCILNACDLHTGTSFRHWMHTYALTKTPNCIVGNGIHVQYYCSLKEIQNGSFGVTIFRKNWMCLILSDYIQ